MHLWRLGVGHHGQRVGLVGNPSPAVGDLHVDLAEPMSGMPGDQVIAPDELSIFMSVGAEASE